jgi:uncharacterized protein YcbK (DUF882 family)
VATRHRLSEHFTVEEFDCHDGTKVSKREYKGLSHLCRVYLEPLRDEFGRVTILSGFRTVSWNRKVGGASQSYHIYTLHDGNDQAADVKCARGNPAEWHRFLSGLRRKERNGKGGLGLYPILGFVHVDIRDYKADWRGT